MAMFLSDHFAVKSMRSGCLSCGNDQPRKLPHGTEAIITMDFDDEFLGVPEFCQSCLEEAAGMVGMVAKRVVDRLTRSVADTKKALKTANEELTDAQATIRVLTAELHKTQEAAGVSA